MARRRILLGSVLVVGLALRLWGSGFSSSTPLGRPDEEDFAIEALAMFTRPYNRLIAGWPSGYYVLCELVFRLERAWFHVRYGGAVNLACLLAVRPLALLWPVRVLSAMLGTLTAWIVGRIAAALTPERADAASVWATAIYAANYLVGRDAHFAVSDACVCLEIAIALLCCVKALVASPRWLIAAGFWAGLAMSTKYSAVGLAVPFGAVAASTLSRRRAHAFASLAWGVVAAAAGAVLLSPQILTHGGELRAGLFGHAQRYASGGPSGLAFYTTVVFPAAFGWPGWMLCLAGLVHVARRPAGVVIALYVGAFLIIVLGPLSHAFVRYGSPLVPALAAAGGPAAAALVARAGATRAIAAAAAIALSTLASPVARVIAFDRLLARPDTRDLARAWLLDRGERHVVLTEGLFAQVHAIDARTAAVCRQELPPPLWARTPTLPTPTPPDPSPPAGPEGPITTYWRTRDVIHQPAAAGLGERGWERIGFLAAVRYVVWEKDQRRGLPDPRRSTAPDYWVRARGPRAIGVILQPQVPELPPPDCWAVVAHFSPGAGEGARWDSFDGFLVPFTGLRAIDRPGPDIVIYRNTCKTGGSPTQSDPPAAREVPPG